MRFMIPLAHTILPHGVLAPTAALPGMWGRKTEREPGAKLPIAEVVQRDPTPSPTFGYFARRLAIMPGLVGRLALRGGRPRRGGRCGRSAARARTAGGRPSGRASPRPP